MDNNHRKGLKGQVFSPKVVEDKYSDHLSRQRSIKGPIYRPDLVRAVNIQNKRAERRLRFDKFRSYLPDGRTMVDIIGITCRICLALGFIFVLFGNPFDSEEVFKSIISNNYAPFDLNTFITEAHSLLPDGIGIFDGLENLFIAIGCVGYAFAFLINLVFTLFFA